MPFAALESIVPTGMSRLSKAAALGVLTGALGVLLSLVPPIGLDLEEQLGLQLLFGLRGPRPAPPEVVVVGIDRASADALGLPGDPAKWPRSVHARLTESLVAAGAAVIVFDIFFESERSAEDDRRFAEAIARAGNVVLARYLALETVPLDAGGGRTGQASVERLVPPLPRLAAAAAASAAFPLPKVPVRVNRYWTFKSGSGGAPTLPVVALQLFALDAYEEFVQLLDRVAPGRASGLPPDGRALRSAGRVEETVGALRAVFEAEPEAAARMLRALAAGDGPARDAGRRRLLEALVLMYRSPESPYLDFYGPARTITTIPYNEALRLPERAAAGAPHLDLRGKAVFVGMSEYRRLEQKDGFYTVFSEQGGRDLSGVEIAATAFANLLEARHVRPLGRAADLGLVFAGGTGLGILCALLPPARAAATAGAAGLLYLAAAHQAFARLALWLPLTVPLLFQLPLAFVGAMLWRYAETDRERQRIRTVFSYYLPDRVIDQLLASVPGSASSSQLVHGVCLATDAERYTTLAESLDPKALAGFMNRYYAAIFEPIRRHGGTVSDVVGDSALAIWAAAESDATLCARACAAACEIIGAVDRFNRTAEALQLPTRIGLHAGEMALGHVGAMDHYEYRAVGDIVNAATRIQGLNKHFGTRILVSADVVSGLDGFLTRRLGTFLLAGKSRPLVIHELIAPRAEASARQVGLVGLFAEALAAYEARAWRRAHEIWSALIREYGDDPVSRFYLRCCEQYQAEPPGESWTGVVRVDRK